MKIRVFGLAAVAAVAFAGVARADRVDFQTTDGMLRLNIARSGEVDGEYPQKNGSLQGRVNAEGFVSGTWTQPRSDKPCSQVRMGTRYWGTFEIANVYSRQPRGFWGYCGEARTNDWKMRR